MHTISRRSFLAGLLASAALVGTACSSDASTTSSKQIDESKLGILWCWEWHIEEVSKQISARLKNFKAIGLRENLMIPYVKEHTSAPVQKVIDPTLLLTPEEYEPITEDRIIEDKYLLLYSRRYSPEMEAYAEKLAKENGWKIVEISLRATNADKGHIMFYQAGVEEFLSLVKNAEFVVTNSFHGMIFSVQMKKQFAGFSRDQCNTKIDELLTLFGLKDCLYVTGKEQYSDIDYDAVHKRIAIERKKSVEFLKYSLNLL